MPTTPLPEPGSTVELVCVRGTFDRLVGQVPPTGPKVLVRTGISSVRPIEGELFQVAVEKSWTFGHTNYLKGQVLATWLDIARLELEPLGLCSRGRQAALDDERLESLPVPLVSELRSAGPREVYEMERILPEGTVELHWEDDPILEAVELVEAGAVDEAEDVLTTLVTADLRCLDAHAHLGLIEFRVPRHQHLERARRRFEVGVAIGRQALGGEFDGLLPWGFIDNRPFLRCLHGLGLTHWREGDLQAAVEIFRRLLQLNPDDNQGVRLIWPDLQQGRPWRDL